MACTCLVHRNIEILTQKLKDSSIEEQVDEVAKQRFALAEFFYTARDTEKVDEIIGALSNTHRSSKISFMQIYELQAKNMLARAYRGLPIDNKEKLSDIFFNNLSKRQSFLGNLAELYYQKGMIESAIAVSLERDENGDKRIFFKKIIMFYSLRFFKELAS